MFSIGLADGLLLLEVEANDRFVGLLDRFLLLDACGGITVSRRPHAVDARPRRLRESRRWRGRERHAIEGMFRLDGDRAAPTRSEAARNLSKTTQRLL
jgi:hypothetical protein